MAYAVRRGAQVWENYHGTASCALADRIELWNDAVTSGRQALSEAAVLVQGLLRQAKAAGVTVRPVGSAWSPAPIAMSPEGWQLEMPRLNRTFRLAPGDLTAGNAVDPVTLILTQGGALVDEINDRVEGELHRSLRTTGASNGQTIAGACATGTHGSVIGAGGIQDHVRAVQIVTPTDVWWVEPAAGFLGDAFIAASGAKPLRDDDAFAAARLAVGSLGIVTALVLETVPRFLVEVFQTKRIVAHAEIDLLAAGDFQGFSRLLGRNEDPYFVQVIVNPYNPTKGKALVKTMYWRDWRPDYPRPGAAPLGASYDTLSLLGDLLERFGFLRGWLLQKAMELSYPDAPKPGEALPIGTWGEITETHTPLGNLFNGSVTVPRADLCRAFDIILKAYTAGGGGNSVTIRFMDAATGLLAPARFDCNAVIDFDGVRSAASLVSYGRVVAALDAAGIAFGRHWAKTNLIDAARVRADYGDKLTRWLAAQARIMPDAADRAVFRAPELVKLGLIG
jgi:FAD/FMN-containing dehydrogenase